MKTVVTEDWQRDALRLVIVDHPAHRVSVVETGPGRSPMFRMVGYDPEALTQDGEEQAGILMPVAVAREVYQALGRHFGDHQDPASRELVDVLQQTQAREADRVDLMLLALIPPIIQRDLSDG